MNSEQNVTKDNFFVSVPLVNDPVTQECLAVIGTVRINKPQLPPEVVQKCPPCSSLFAFKENQTVVSYVLKKYRNVILISRMQDSSDIDESTGDKYKPHMLTFTIVCQ